MGQKVRRRWGKNGGLGTNWIKRGAKIYGSTNISKKEPTVNGMMEGSAHQVCLKSSCRCNEGSAGHVRGERR